MGLSNGTRDDERRDKPPELAEGIFYLTRELHEVHRAINSHIGNNAILTRLAEMEERIMSKISDFAAAQKAFNSEIGKDIDSLVTSAEAQATATAGLAGDIDNLNAKIVELQNSQGGVTPEDQVLIDELQAEGAATAARVKAAAAASAAHAAALQALDEKTPPVVPTAA